MKIELFVMNLWINAACLLNYPYLTKIKLSTLTCCISSALWGTGSYSSSFKISYQWLFHFEPRWLKCGSSYILCHALLKEAILLHKEALVKSHSNRTVQIKLRGFNKVNIFYNSYPHSLYLGPLVKLKIPIQRNKSSQATAVKIWLITTIIVRQPTHPIG